MDIYEKLKKYKNHTMFSYAKCDDNDILKIEKMLKVKLPKDYIKFLKTFGEGGLGGVEIFGIKSAGQFSVVDETEYYKKYGLPKELVVIENCDEWVNCINTINEKVVMWDSDGFYKECYDNFHEFLIDSVNEAISNL